MDVPEPGDERRLPRAIVREAVVPLHVARVPLGRPPQTPVAVELAEAVPVTGAVQQALDRAAGLDVAELLSRGAPEVIARVRSRGRREGARERERRGHCKADRGQKRKLADAVRHRPWASARRGLMSSEAEATGGGHSERRPARVGAGRRRACRWRNRCRR